MENERKVYSVQNINGVMRYKEVSADPVKCLESAYVDAYSELPFTAHDELEEYMTKFEEQNHRSKFKLKTLRESKHITIPDMAMLLGISKDGYFKIESGATNPKIDMAFKIARLLDTTVDELLGVI
ncbi:MAG: helix-turn-helix transcriptional regulator [Clostridia bacterium]|nr:helix-turn-helix transcriptional regulator [Clostridia bacterium]